jgi:heat shock protein HslJ
MLSKKNYVFLFVISSVIFFSSCSNTSAPDTISTSDMQSIKNVQWTLKYIQASGRKTSVSNYNPFILVLSDEVVWAYNKCNYLIGNYIITGENWNWEAGGPTEVACPDYITIPFDHLLGNSKITVDGNKLIFYKNNTQYIYTSDFVNYEPPVELLNETLTLKKSNDENISVFNDIDSYPTLIFQSKNEFKLTWNNIPASGTPYQNQYTGIYGINDKNELLFTRMGASYSGNGISINDKVLADSIIQSGKYSYYRGTLKIINEDTGTYYEFSK